MVQFGGCGFHSCINRHLCGCRFHSCTGWLSNNGCGLHSCTGWLSNHVGVVFTHALPDSEIMWVWFHPRTSWQQLCGCGSVVHALADSAIVWAWLSCMHLLTQQLCGRGFDSCTGWPSNTVHLLTQQLCGCGFTRAAIVGVAFTHARTCWLTSYVGVAFTCTGWLSNYGVLLLIWERVLTNYKSLCYMMYSQRNIDREIKFDAWWSKDSNHNIYTTATSCNFLLLLADSFSSLSVTQQAGRLLNNPSRICVVWLSWTSRCWASHQSWGLIMAYYACNIHL